MEVITLPFFASHCLYYQNQYSKILLNLPIQHKQEQKDPFNIANSMQNNFNYSTNILCSIITSMPSLVSYQIQNFKIHLIIKFESAHYLSFSLWCV